MDKKRLSQPSTTLAKIGRLETLESLIDRRVFHVLRQIVPQTVLTLLNCPDGNAKLALNPSKTIIAHFHLIRWTYRKDNSDRRLSFLPWRELHVIQPDFPRNKVVKFPAGQAHQPDHDQFRFWPGREVQKQRGPSFGIAD